MSPALRERILRLMKKQAEERRKEEEGGEKRRVRVRAVLQSGEHPINEGGRENDAKGFCERAREIQALARKEEGERARRAGAGEETARRREGRGRGPVPTIRAARADPCREDLDDSFSNASDESFHSVESQKEGEEDVRPGEFVRDLVEGHRVRSGGRASVRRARSLLDEAGSANLAPLRRAQVLAKLSEIEVDAQLSAGLILPSAGPAKGRRLPEVALFLLKLFEGQASAENGACLVAALRLFVRCLKAAERAPAIPGHLKHALLRRLLGLWGEDRELTHYACKLLLQLVTRDAMLFLRKDSGIDLQHVLKSMLSSNRKYPQVGPSVYPSVPLSEGTFSSSFPSASSARSTSIATKPRFCLRLWHPRGRITTSASPSPRFWTAGPPARTLCTCFITFWT